MRFEQTNEELQLITIRQAAKQLCCSVANVYSLVESGRLAVIPVGRCKGYRIDVRDLNAFIQEHKFRFQVPPKKPMATKLKHVRL